MIGRTCSCNQINWEAKTPNAADNGLSEILNLLHA